MNLEEWKESGLQLIKALRIRGEEESFRRLLSDLYPDKAHFIYELFQNAEDAKAESCRFTLTESSLKFEHNGTRLFSEKDVKSITSFGNSTKREDPTSIGKFGVGFKAVFAYTNTPEVHSGDFHFRIHDLVVPETNGVNKPVLCDRETRFLFPFDHSKKLPAEAADEIERGLRTLGDNTLLFLEHIRSIEYQLSDNSTGSLKRIDHDAGHIEIQACHPGGSVIITHWLRFQKNVEVIDEDGAPKSCRIAVAFSLVQDDDKKNPPDWKIVPLDSGQVSIYFPAEKEKSDLRFHIHAPFASTVARDSVRASQANNKLRDHIAELVVESITSIREKGLLKVGFLAVLPNHADPLTPFYQPIRNDIIRAFRDNAFTPTRSGGYAPATRLYRGPAKISDVLNDDDLSLLTGFAPPLWAANPRQQNQREDQFLKSLDIEDWGWSELSSAVSDLDDDERQNIEGWIIQKDDAWLMRFYALLGEACDSHYACADVGELLLVRIETAQRHEHVTPKKAFFPPEDGMLLPDIFYVKASVFRAGTSESQKKYSESFLKQVGVRPFDEKAVIELSLEQFNQPPEQVRPSYFINVNNYIAHWKKNPNDASLFRARNFLRGVSIDGNMHWRKPTQLCLDNPYEETGLAAFAKIHAKDAIWDGYKEKLTESQLKDFIDFLKAIGVMHELKVERIKIKGNPHERQLRNHFNGGRAIFQTHTATDDDYSITSIEKYLATESILASRLVWNVLVHADRKSATARFRPNQQYGIREAESQLVCILKQHAWIPDKSGEFRLPQEVTQDDLRTDFPFDNRNGLLTAIGFGEKARQCSEEYCAKNQEARKLGLPSVEVAEELAEILKSGVSIDEIRALKPNRKIDLPDRTSPAPEKRAKKIADEVRTMPAKMTEVRPRTVKPDYTQVQSDARIYLKDQCKYDNGMMLCQLCQKAQPVMLNGEPYFEAVDCISDLKKEIRYNKLALCPNHAAMYKNSNLSSDTVQLAILECKGQKIPLNLAGNEVELYFTQQHLGDLRAALLALNSEEK